jgi:hypothetical protein
VTVTVTGQTGAMKSGSLRIFAEDAKATRTQLGSWGVGSPVTVAIPGGSRRIAALLQGEDGAGPLVVVGEIAAAR